MPIPYPNTAELTSCDGTIDTVLVANKEAVVESSSISSSMGDEAGTAGGVVSGLNRGAVQFKLYSSSVYAAGKKMVFHTAQTSHNGTNANLPAGTQVAPSQSSVLVGV